jgi:hypothetical protein
MRRYRDYIYFFSPETTSVVDMMISFHSPHMQKGAFKLLPPSSRGKAAGVHKRRMSKRNSLINRNLCFHLSKNIS